MALEENGTVILTLDELKSLLNSNRPTQDEQLALIQAQAEANAEANRKALRPENTFHPGISVFSRPGGEQANPKGELGFKLTWAGSDVDNDSVTAEEFDLLKQLSAGQFVCARPDGSKFSVEITASVNPTTGKTDRMDVFFATRGHLRHGLPSMVVMCRDLIAQAASKGSVRVA
jgi:hypothetical protein